MFKISLELGYNIHIRYQKIYVQKHFKKMKLNVAENYSGLCRKTGKLKKRA